MIGDSGQNLGLSQGQVVPTDEEVSEQFERATEEIMDIFSDPMFQKKAGCG